MHRLVRFLDASGRRSAGRAAAPSGNRRRRRPLRLRVETLESRCLNTASAAAGAVVPDWFDVVDDDADRHAGYAELVADSLGNTVRTTVADSTNTYDWIVRFTSQAVTGVTSPAGTSALLASTGLDFQVLRGLGLVGQVLVRTYNAAPEAVSSLLAGDADVAGFELDTLAKVGATPNDSQMSQLWGLSKIAAPSAWNVSTGSRSVVVGVIDTGVDYTHRDLAANMWTNAGEIAGNGIDDDRNGLVDDRNGYNFVADTGNPMDDNGHGTHVAGTIGAVGNNALGVAGVNWSVSIMALKFLDGDGSGYTSDAVRAVNYATMQRTQYGVNVRVLNNSWGGGGYSSALRDAFRAAGDAGIIATAAAGNEGQNNDRTASYPANFDSPNLLSVAATDSSDRLASFSNYGAQAVDLAAPGVSILSTVPGNRYASYAGTSMATPHVSGVAALAWAVNPNATVAQVRDALLRGVDKISGLSGKMVTGGRLNAYNTLRLVGGSQSQAPTLGGLAVSPGTAPIGQTVTLTASGAAAASGSVAGVSFYLDTNANNQWDSGDRLLGSTTTVNSGAATLSLGTSGYAAGSYTLFARAQGSNNLWSNAVSATLQLTAADNHGNDAARATSIAIGSTTSGGIETLGDVDYFAFRAVSGRLYTARVTLGSLRDSTLTLYGPNGTTQLAFNDDLPSGEFSSMIAWTAPASGTYYLKVAAYGNAYTGTYSLKLDGQNRAPALAAIANQTLARGAASLSVNLQASDADGDPLSYTAAVASQAYDLDQALGLRAFDGNYYTNRRGAQEKYFIGNGSEWYFILPNGDFYHWGGSIAASQKMTNVGTQCYVNPSLLDAAKAPDALPVTTSVNQQTGVLTISRGGSIAGSFHVRVTVSDGSASAVQYFHVEVANQAPTVAAVASHAIRGPAAVSLQAADPDGDALTLSATVSSRAYDLDQALGLRTFNGDLYENRRGAQEKYLIGSGDQWYFLRPGGALYRWEGSIAASTLVTTLDAGVYADPALLYNAEAPSSIPVRLSVNPQTRVLTIDPAAGYSGSFEVRLAASDGSAETVQYFRVTVGGAAGQAVKPSAAARVSAQAADGVPLLAATGAALRTPAARHAGGLSQLQAWQAVPGGAPTVGAAAAHAEALLQAWAGWAAAGDGSHAQAAPSAATLGQALSDAAHAGGDAQRRLDAILAALEGLGVA